MKKKLRHNKMPEDCAFQNLYVGPMLVINGLKNGSHVELSHLNCLFGFDARDMGTDWILTVKHKKTSVPPL